MPQSAPHSNPASNSTTTAHGQAFLTFVYALLNSQEGHLVPPGATPDGLAAAFRSREFLDTLSRILTTFALQSLLKRAPLIPPAVPQDHERTVRAAPWQPPLSERLDLSLHPRTIGVLAQLFLLSSHVAKSAGVSSEGRPEIAEEFQNTRWTLEAESIGAAGAASQSPWAWAKALGAGKASLEAMAYCPPGRLFGKDDAVGPLDLVLLDQTIVAARECAYRVRRVTETLEGYWNGVADRTVDVSPLTQLYAVDWVAVPPPNSPRRGPERCAAALAPLFTHGNQLFLRYIEATVVESWLKAQKLRHERDDAQWADAIVHFTDVLAALIHVAESTRLVSPLTVIPRFFGVYTRNFRDDTFTREMRMRMKSRRKFVDKENFVKSVLALFAPLYTFDGLVTRLRRMNWAERTSEENFLVLDPAANATVPLQNVAFCREKLQLSTLMAASSTSASGSASA